MERRCTRESAVARNNGSQDHSRLVSTSAGTHNHTRRMTHDQRQICGTRHVDTWKEKRNTTQKVDTCWTTTRESDDRMLFRSTGQTSYPVCLPFLPSAVGPTSAEPLSGTWEGRGASLRGMGKVENQSPRLATKTVRCTRCVQRATRDSQCSACAVAIRTQQRPGAWTHRRRTEGEPRCS